MNTPLENEPTILIRLGSDFLWWLMIGIVVVGVLSVFVRRKLRPTAKGSTVLLAHTFQDAEAVPVKGGTTKTGLYWQYYVGASQALSTMRGVYAVELPFKSGVHLLGIPKKGEDFDINTWGSVMEPVVLEGDYPNYFSLYADIGEQQQTRFVLDPKAMVFTVDFCKDFSWEIVDDTLYVASEERTAPLDLINQFVREIRPAIEVASDRTQDPQLKMPYAHFEGREIDCPICTKQLVPAAEWLGCPDGHGVLVTGSQLQSIRGVNHAGGVDIPEVNVERSGNNPVGHTELQCPYCHSLMKSTQFAFTNVQIDVCPKCMFRWLDAGESKRLLVD